jgi:sec-independent protein translocase protein TatA
MAMFGLPGGAELWIILGVVLIIFGPTQLPKLAKMFGKSAKTLKDGLDGKLADEDEKPASDKVEAAPNVETADKVDKDAEKPE